MKTIWFFFSCPFESIYPIWNRTCSLYLDRFYIYICLICFKWLFVLRIEALFFSLHFSQHFSFILLVSPSNPPPPFRLSFLRCLSFHCFSFHSGSSSCVICLQIVFVAIAQCFVCHSSFFLCLSYIVGVRMHELHTNIVLNVLQSVWYSFSEYTKKPS